MEHQDHLKTFNLIKDQTVSAFGRSPNIPPHIIRVKGDQKDIFFIAEMSNDLEKDIIVRLMKQIIRHGADAVCFCCEAWSVEGAYDKEYEDVLKKYKMPSCHPDRIEIAMMQYTWAGGEIWGTSPIIRPEYDPWDDDANPEDFEEFDPVLVEEWRVIDSSKGDEIKKEGRFCNLWEAAFEEEDDESIDIRCVNMEELDEISKGGECGDPISLDELDQIWHKGLPPFDR